MGRFDVVIVGAGHGGANTAIALRQLGFAGSIALIGAEPDLPYERPPLTKEFLLGEKAFERMLLRPEAFWAERDIGLVLDTKVTAVDAQRRQLECGPGTSMEYGALVWAAGGEPRRLSCSGNDLAGVHGIRTRGDTEKLKAELQNVGRVVVIGGGYIGLEAAAALTKLGKQVILLEALDRVLARVAGPELSAFFEAEHRRNGVDLRTNVVVECIEEAEGRACGVRLEGGEVVPADMVIVGIGIVPSVEPLLAAGCAGENGVDVDEYCRTSMDDIYAIGDCAAHPNRFADNAVIRVESVQNANDQAATVAKALVGRREPYEAVPWFWSYQYDLRLQTIGLSTGYDRSILRGDPASRSFSIVYLRREIVIALDCVNAVRDYAQGRKLVESGLLIDPALLADADIALKDVMSANRLATT